MSEDRRHPPTYLLWVAGRYVAVCRCHYFQPVTLTEPTVRRAA